MTESLLPRAPRPARLWPLWLILIGGLIAVAVVRLNPGSTFQDRNLRSLLIAVITGVLCLLWWLFLSRLPWKTRGLGLLAVVGALVIGKGLFRIRGVSGDLLPILEPRWISPPVLPTAAAATNALPARANTQDAPARADFPQYLGPSRDTTIAGLVLNPDWAAHPPQVLWRIPVGAAWSGFVIVGNRAITQEQRGDDEWVTCRDLATGRMLWEHADPAKYDTVIAGTGPRQTPVVVADRVFTMGATGVINCLELATGRRLWGTNLLTLAQRDSEVKGGVPGQRTNLARIPDWGYAGTPLVVDDKVIVQPGGDGGRSLVAFNATTGALVWNVGDESGDYSSPTLLTLAGVRQVLIFSSRQISAHDPATGRLLWQHPFGTHYPLVANPLAVGPDRVLLSAGYGVGAELLDIKPGTNGSLTATTVWSSRRLKAKFHHPVRRGDFAYALDDGIWACLDLKDGSQPWKSGRYGHGQGLLVGEHYLLMAENGELVLLQPTPEAPHELSKFRIFDRKTWNPPALSGEFLLVRNDVEAVLLKLALK